MEHNLRPTSRREQTIVRYDPLASQKAFHNSQARFKCFMGPVGSGKTQALCQEVLKSVHRNPGRIGLIGAPTFGVLKDATTVALLEVLEENEIGYVLNQSNYTITFLVDCPRERYTMTDAACGVGVFPAEGLGVFGIGVDIAA